MCEDSPNPCFEDLIQSDLFNFSIGEEKRQFVTHSGAVATTSEYFTALVNGDMVEAKTRFAEFPDVKPEDFARFLEYAYRHDYTIPPCIEDEDIEPPATETHTEPPAPEPEPEPMPVEEPAPMELVPEPVNDEWDEAPRPKRIIKNKKRVPKLRSIFDKRNYLTTGDPKAGLLQGFEPQPNSSPQQNFAPVFLAHARLYTFADMRLVQPLRDLTLHKLHKTLMGFQLYHQRVGDVLELTRYAYDHGPDRTSKGTIDDLRKLVVEYVACNLDTIGKHNGFMQLMEEGGEFVGDFWRIMQKHLISGVNGWTI